jgi:RimJ/RimL family protein N-acetyltransferase
MKELQTRRLVLEPVSVSNARTMWRLMQGPDLRVYQDVPRYSYEEFRRRVNERARVFDARATGRFEWIVLPRDSAPAGWICLRVGEAAKNSAELGYTLLPEHRGRGYAAEAVAAVVEHAFSVSTLRRVEACCVPENIASRRVLERAGFRLVRIQRSGAVVRSRAVEVMLFEMRRSEFAQLYGSSANSIDIAASVNS